MNLSAKLVFYNYKFNEMLKEAFFSPLGWLRVHECHNLSVFLVVGS